MVQDEDIHSTLSTLQSNLPLAAKQLVQLANDCGGRDNISVILVRILADFAVPKGWLAKFTAWFR
jgi:protein phosphatase